MSSTLYELWRFSRQAWKVSIFFRIIFLKDFSVKQDMGEYAVFGSDQFRRHYAKISGHEKQWVDLMWGNLEEQVSGKPLGYSWLREKKYRNKRLLFLVDEKMKRILILGFVSKKQQQNAINFILCHREGFFHYLRAFP